MKYIAGVDIGNSTTEVCIGEDYFRGQSSLFVKRFMSKQLVRKEQLKIRMQ